MNILGALTELDHALARECGNRDTEITLVMENKLLFQIAIAFERSMPILGLAKQAPPYSLIQYRPHPTAMAVMPYITLQPGSRTIKLVGAELIDITMEKTL